MEPNVYLDALNKALNAELIQWGGSEATGGVRRRGRAIAALLFGASTAVGHTEELAAVVPPPAPTTTQALGSAPIVPARFRPASDRSETIGRVAANGLHWVRNESQPAR